MFKDEHRYRIWEELRQRSLLEFNTLLTPALATAVVDARVRVSTSPLGIEQLVSLAITSAILCTWNFASVLSFTLKVLEMQPQFGRWSRMACFTTAAS